MQLGFGGPKFYETPTREEQLRRDLESCKRAMNDAIGLLLPLIGVKAADDARSRLGNTISTIREVGEMLEKRWEAEAKKDPVVAL